MNPCSTTSTESSAAAMAEKLRVSEQRVRLLLESAADYAIFSMDLQRRVDYWSAGAERIFGYSEAQIKGLSGDLIFTEEDRKAGAPETEAGHALAHGRAADERWHLRLDGTRFYASGVLAPLRGDGGRIVGFVKIARDLTERRIAEEQLRHGRDELERRVRERTAELDIANEELRAEMEQRRQAEGLRREAVHRISEVQEEERRRLSRELHDELGQRCAALLLGLRTLDWSGPDREQQMKPLIAMAEQISFEIHSVAVQLRPTSLDDIGLAGALASYVDLWSKRTGIRVQLHTAGVSDPRLNPAVELAIYRIIQEALTNVMKHAEAKLVAIVVDRRPDEVRALIEDDGKGFCTQDDRRAPRGLGLVGMNERADEFGGSVALESSIGHGTSVIVRIPLS